MAYIEVLYIRVSRNGKWCNWCVEIVYFWIPLIVLRYFYRLPFFIFCFPVFVNLLPEIR